MNNSDYVLASFPFEELWSFYLSILILFLGYFRFLMLAIVLNKCLALLLS
jgi:hypothetical protein